MSKILLLINTTRCTSNIGFNEVQNLPDSVVNFCLSESLPTVEGHDDEHGCCKLLFTTPVDPTG